MPDPKLRVIFEDNHLIAINKPAGLLVHDDNTGDETALQKVKDYIKVRYNKPGDVFLNLVHRLDRPVSGVLLFARTSKALTRMNDIIKERKIEKTYKAVVAARPNPLEGTLINYLQKDKSRNISSVVKSNKKDAKYCELNYKLELSFSERHILNVDLLTGRSHQIRVQLSHAGMPIVGDVKYGYDKPLRDSSIALHCSDMSFIHPVKKEKIRITASIPDTDFWNTMKQF
jgi:23S rRNA pseudouridine1911/1915/1917 synthase